jgi:hypothetical protein
VIWPQRGCKRDAQFELGVERVSAVSQLRVVVAEAKDSLGTQRKGNV